LAFDIETAINLKTLSRNFLFDEKDLSALL